MNLEYLNTLLLQAEESGDGASLAELVTEDFIIIRAKGSRENKQEFVAASGGGAKKGRVQSEFEEMPLGEATLVRLKITTHIEVENKATNKVETIITHYWNTRVFVQEGGVWKCKAWQVTEIL